MVMIPRYRPPTTPGRLLERFLADHGLTQTELARRTGVRVQRINQIMRVRRAISPDTALRLARLFGTTPDLWLNAQLAWDLWHAEQESGLEIERVVEPLPPLDGTMRRDEAGVARAEPARPAEAFKVGEPAIAFERAARRPANLERRRKAPGKAGGSGRAAGGSSRARKSSPGRATTSRRSQEGPKRRSKPG